MGSDDPEQFEFRSTGSHSTGSHSTGSLSVADVAARMQVSKMTVYRLVHSGELSAVRVGRSFRVSRAAVEEYLRGVYFDAG